MFNHIEDIPLLSQDHIEVDLLRRSLSYRRVMIRSFGRLIRVVVRRSLMNVGVPGSTTMLESTLSVGRVSRLSSSHTDIVSLPLGLILHKNLTHNFIGKLEDICILLDGST